MGCFSQSKNAWDRWTNCEFNKNPTQYTDEDNICIRKKAHGFRSNEFGTRLPQEEVRMIKMIQRYEETIEI